MTVDCGISEQKDCYNCKGEGKVWVYDGRWMIETTCPDCLGRGVVEKGRESD